MHAKVTIASLVFGLAIGLSVSIGSNQKTINAKEENMVCNHDNHENIEFSTNIKMTVVTQKIMIES